MGAGQQPGKGKGGMNSMNGMNMGMDQGGMNQMSMQQMMNQMQQMMSQMQSGMGGCGSDGGMGGCGQPQVVMPNQGMMPQRVVPPPKPQLDFNTPGMTQEQTEM